MLKEKYIYNDKYVVVLPTMSLEYLEGIEYSFKNVIIYDNTKDINKLIKFLNKSNFSQIIFVDYQLEYKEVIRSLNKKHEINILFTGSMGAFSNSFIYDIFKSIMDLYNECIVSKIGFLDENLYNVMKKQNINCSHIKLDLPTQNAAKSFISNRVGVLSNQENPRHSFYNELSALKFNNYEAVLYNPSKETKKFLKLFNIKSKNYKNYEDVIKNNLVNLYINFTDNNNLIFIKSMDLGVPCILGNNELLKRNKFLNSMLVVKSDDSIDEIAEKIKLVKKNRKAILEEYNSYRQKYSKESKNSINEFLGFKLEVKNKTVEADLLLSIIVPVYNTEKYLKGSLKSIIKAVPKCILNKTEILIINDGSTDNSEYIINKYVNKYPNLIRYIKQKNHGLGNVRNVGLKNAKGKYIASIDSDDTINPRFFEGFAEASKDDIDIIMCDWLSITNESKFITSAIEWIFKDINKYEGILYTTIMPSTCNKIIKKSLYDEMKISYYEDKYEDLSTNPFILLKAKSISYNAKSYYEYYIRSNSIMRSSAGYSMIDVIKVVDQRLNKYIDYVNVDIEKFKFYTYSWRIEEFIFNQLYTIEENNLEEFIEKVYSIKDIILDIFKNHYYINMLSNLKDENLKKYINKRNSAFENMKLLDFAKKSRKNKEEQKLNAPIIYFGK